MLPLLFPFSDLPAAFAQVVHPLIQQLQDESGVFDDCKQCLHATRSVMDANLLLFKTVIAGAFANPGFQVTPHLMRHIWI